MANFWLQGLIPGDARTRWCRARPTELNLEAAVVDASGGFSIAPPSGVEWAGAAVQPYRGCATWRTHSRSCDLNAPFSLRPVQVPLAGQADPEVAGTGIAGSAGMAASSNFRQNFELPCRVDRRFCSPCLIRLKPKFWRSTEVRRRLTKLRNRSPLGSPCGVGFCNWIGAGGRFG